MPGQVLTLGCKILREATPGGGTYTNIGHLASFDGPQFTSERVDVTDGDSDGREYLAGLQSPGSLPFVLNVDPTSTTQQQLLTDIQTVPQLNKSYRLQPTSDDVSFFEGDGFVEQLNFSGNAQNGVFQVNAQLGLSGLWEFTPP
jgi:hypothetical protein